MSLKIVGIESKCAIRASEKFTAEGHNRTQAHCHQNVSDIKQDIVERSSTVSVLNCLTRCLGTLSLPQPLIELDFLQRQVRLNNTAIRHSVADVRAVVHRRIDCCLPRLSGGKSWQTPSSKHCGLLSGTGCLFLGFVTNTTAAIGMGNFLDALRAKCGCQYVDEAGCK